MHFHSSFPERQQRWGYGGSEGDNRGGDGDGGGETICLVREMKIDHLFCKICTIYIC